MSSAQILVLGGVAGSTIFLGLPVGRMQSVSPRVKSFLSAAATGILLFLIWDVLSAAVDPVESALKSGRDARFFGLAALLAVGFGIGLLSLELYDGWLKRRRDRALLGPGAASMAEFELERHVVTMSPSRWLSIFIATGIGLHNFSEGLAIGQSAARDELSLALVLIIGFGLHNATEGFGIVAPLAGDKDPPSWRFLGLLGLIGGGPTFVGTLVGQTWVSEALSVMFLALAAGSILYVVVELIAICRRFASKELVLTGILVGLVLGFATDFVLVAAGA
ncbi:MAG: zinc permease [Actinobacteria bacterium]|nr:MAG: zinc permease [Actinomycetota bacterium]